MIRMECFGKTIIGHCKPAVMMERVFRCVENEGYTLVPGVGIECPPGNARQGAMRLQDVWMRLRAEQRSTIVFSPRGRRRQRIKDKLACARVLLRCRAAS